MGDASRRSRQAIVALALGGCCAVAAGPLAAGAQPTGVAASATTTTATVAPTSPSHHRSHARPAYPSAARIATAERFLDTRAGHTALAVVDSHGHLSGVREYETFETASLVKAMILVAFLQLRASEHRGLDAADRSLLGPMIQVSDNDAASAVLAIIGPAALVRIAHQAHMRSFANGVGWWAYAQTSAADQARFFAKQDRLIPPQFDGYARWLLSHIIAWQTWGVTAIAGPAFEVFAKSGSFPSRSLTHIVARFERPHRTFTAAILTDDEPSTSYGVETIDGVVARLLGKAP
jgi:hypothetical protein